MHDDHLLLGAGHEVRRDLVVTTRILVFGLAAEPLLLDARHVQHIRVRENFLQCAVVSLKGKNIKSPFTPNVSVNQYSTL